MRTTIAGLSLADYYKKYRKDNHSRLIQNERNRLSTPLGRKRQRANAKCHYAKNKEAEKARIQCYRSTLGGKIAIWKWAAKRRGIPWNLTDEFIRKLRPVCHYTGLELTQGIGKPNTFSLDRIDSNLDYSADNVVPCCAVINWMKSDLLVQEFIEMCRLVSKCNSHTTA